MDVHSAVCRRSHMRVTGKSARLHMRSMIRPLLGKTSSFRRRKSVLSVEDVLGVCEIKNRVSFEKRASQVPCSADPLSMSH